MKIKDIVCEDKDQLMLEQLLAEGEPDKEENAEDKEENSAEEQPEDDSSSDEEEQAKPFANLDLREAYCFGWEKDAKKKCWYNKCLEAKAIGWKKADTSSIELSLKKNVDACYFYLVSFYFVDLDDEIRWHAFFDNSKGLWRLEIQDSPKAEIESQQYADFFGSELMKKAASRAYDLIMRAQKEFEETLRFRLEGGELLMVDEIKLGAVLHFINDSLLMENLKACKWVQ